MPRVLVFTPCSRTFVDQGDSAVALVSLIEAINFVLEPDDIDPNLVVSVPWTVFVLMLREPGDEDKEFEFWINATLPDQTETEGETRPFRISGRTQRLTLTLRTFRVWPAGERTINLRIRECGPAEPWQLVGTYPILVEHVFGERS